MEIIVQKEHFSESLNSCLKNAFGEHHSEKDQFNKDSEYIVIYCRTEIAALGRFSKCPNGVFFLWTNGASNFSNTLDSLDLGRCLVVEKFRGGIFYDLLVSYCLRYAFQKGYRYVNGAALLGKRMVDRLAYYGFNKSGDPIPIFPPNGNEYQIQAYTADLDNTKNIWGAVLLDCQSQFERQGYNFVEKLL